MGRAIILAYYFPPMVGAASDRAAAFARHLPAAGWTPTVVTPRQGLYHRDLRQELPQVRVLRTASPELSRALQGIARRRKPGQAVGSSLEVRPALAHTAAAPIRRLVREWIYLPDAQIGWIPFAITATRKALEEGISRPAVLISSSVPISAHLAARSVAKRTGTPWIADFRDPWSTVSDSIRPRSGLRKRIDHSIEARIARDADRVLVTSEAVAEAFRHVHPELEPSSLRVIRNGFEPITSRHREGGTKDDVLRLVFAGSVPPQVSVVPLLSGIARVNGRQPGHVVLRVCGPAERWKEASKELGGLDWLELEGPVSASVARLAVGSAAANVLCLPGAEYSGIVAAKLYEYLGARRPILGVLPPGSEMERLCRRHGDLRLISPYDASRVGAAITKLLEEKRRGLLDRPVRPVEDVDALSWRARTKELSEVLEEVARPST